jgi:hypothetical protein
MNARRPSFDDVNAAALAQYPGLLQSWFPNGRLHGHEFRVGNLQGEPGESLSVNIRTGVWRDFASDDAGSDPISLYAAIYGLKQGEAKNRLAEDLGLVASGAGSHAATAKTSSPGDTRATCAKGKSPEERIATARTIWDASVPALHTPAQAYLQGRGITIGLPDCIRYHAGNHALVALVQARDGAFSGVQCVYLKTDARGTWKRPETKKRKSRLSFGIIKGAAVRLFPSEVTLLLESLLLTESVEDGLALHQMTGRAVWAVPGVWNMENFAPPPGLQELSLSPDHDDAGLETLDKAYRVHAGRIPKVRRLLPPPGKDWCDMLDLFEEHSAMEQEPETERSWVKEFVNG